jgi:hypothetical protein
MFIRIRRHRQGIPSWVFLPPTTFIQLHISYYNIDLIVAASNPPQKGRGDSIPATTKETRRYRRRPPSFNVTSAHARFTSVSRKKKEKRTDSHRLTLTPRPRASAQTVPAASPAKAHERPYRDLPAQRSRSRSLRWPSHSRVRTDSATSFGAGGGPGH